MYLAARGIHRTVNICPPPLQGRKNFPSTLLSSIAGSMKCTDNRQFNRRKGIQIYSLLILHASGDQRKEKEKYPKKEWELRAYITF